MRLQVPVNHSHNHMGMGYLPEKRPRTITIRQVNLWSQGHLSESRLKTVTTQDCRLVLERTFQTLLIQFPYAITLILMRPAIQMRCQPILLQPGLG